MNASPSKPTAADDKKMAAMLAMLVALMPLSIDTYLPAIPAMAHDLNADIHRIEQSLSLFLFGVAAGQVFGGTVSDIKGRRPVALAGLVVYAAGVLGLLLVQTGSQLLVLRVVQAFGAGMTVVIVGATVRDRYQGREAAQMFALIGIILMSVPLLAPALGALLQSLGGWRLVFGFLMLYAAGIGWLLWRKMPKPESVGCIGRGVFADVVGRYRRVLGTRPALGYLFFQAFSFSSMFSFLTESPFVYMKLYGVSTHDYGWLFALNVVTMASFNRITAWRLKSGTHPQQILKAGILVQFAANLVLLLSVAVLELPPLWMLAACVMFSVGTQGLVTANTQACFMGYFSKESGSANAVLGVSQSVIGASMGLLATWLHNGSAIVMACMMFVSTTLGIMLLWLFSHQAWALNSVREP
ncbi:multidrug effflux MFS transporter [Neisseria sp.]|uniref:multidrug effflux MFS transporter n=1 Tax=Neisseria sp. TaxID=192066 RepID=UPI0035A171C3